MWLLSHPAFLAFNPVLAFPLLSEGPVGQEEGKLGQLMVKRSWEDVSAIAGSTVPPSGFSRGFWCKFIDLIAVIPDLHNSEQ